MELKRRFDIVSTVYSIKSYLNGVTKAHQSPAICLAKVQQWCESEGRITVPDDPTSDCIHKPFVAGFECNAGHVSLPWFHLLLTTRNLIQSAYCQNTAVKTCLHIEPISHISLLGYHMMILGVGSSSAFHPLAFALFSQGHDRYNLLNFICKAINATIRALFAKQNTGDELHPPLFHPDYVMSGVGDKFFKSAFDYGVGKDSSRCCPLYLIDSASVFRLLHHNFWCGRLDEFAAFCADFHLLYQKSPSLMCFHWALNLLFEKWTDRLKSSTSEFHIIVNQLQKDANFLTPNWFKMDSSHRHSYEHFTREIRDKIRGVVDENKCEKGLQLDQFLTLFESQIVEVLSKSQTDTVTKVTCVEITTRNWEEGYSWARDTNQLTIKISDDLFYAKDVSTDTDCSSASFDADTLGVIATDLENFALKSFDDFATKMENLFVINFDKCENVGIRLKDASCNCETFRQNFKCIHVLGMLIRLNSVDIPSHIVEKIKND